MFELDFNIDEILEELEGKTVEEKLEALDDIAYDLQSALDDISDAQEEIKKQHIAETEANIMADVNSFIAGRSLQKQVTASEKTVVLDYDKAKVEIYFFHVEDEEWIVGLHLLTNIVSNDLRYQLFNELASAIDAEYKEGNDDISVKVDADEVAWTMNDWIQKLSL